MRAIKSKKRYLVCCIGLVLASQSGANAATKSDEKVENKDVEIITVSGIRGSVVRSLANKYSDSNIADSISAEDLGKFPDLNLSESLQRIPGVTINRNVNGEGSQINVRGLGPQFTRVEINGMTGPASGTSGRLGTNGGGRGFSFELLPSELFSSATVTKSSEATQSEGGLAGVVTLETPKPLQHTQGLKFSSSLQGSYSNEPSEISPRAFFTISNNIDDDFGISFGIAHSKSEFKTDAVENGVWRPLSAIIKNSYTDQERADFTDSQNSALNALVANGTRYYSFHEARDNTAATLTLQYRPSDTLELTFDTIYAQLSNERAAHRNDIPLENGDVRPDFDSLVIENSVIVAGSFDNVQHRVGPRVTDIDDTFVQSSLSVIWKPDDLWTITPYIGFSKREADRKQSLLSFRGNTDTGGIAPGVLSYKVRGDFVDFSSTYTDFSTNPEDFSLNVLIFRPSIDESTESTGKLDFIRYIDHDNVSQIQFGARYTVQNKKVIEQDYRIARAGGTNQNLNPSVADVMLQFDYGVSGAGSDTPTSMFSVDPKGFQDIFFVDGIVSPNGTAIHPNTSVQNRPLSTALNTYEIEEKTLNLYVQADLEWDDLSAKVGLRYLKTDQTSAGSGVTATKDIFSIVDKRDYTEWLPSVSLRYEVEDGVILRAAFSKTLTRPNLPDLAPSEVVFAPDPTSATGNLGNPGLDPFTSNNFDISAEWYFDDEGLLSANVFYKDLSGLIDSSNFTAKRDFVTQLGEEVINGDVFFTQKTNGDSASIQGFEIAYQQPFTFAPEGFLQDFGLIINYSQTESNADFSIENDIRSVGLPGLSPTSYNVSFYYDDGKLDAKLSYAWRERYLAQTSDDFGEPRFTDDFGQLDLSANYRITDNLQVQFQVLNLTNEQLVSQTYRQEVGYLPYGVTDLKRRILFGVRYSF